MLGHVAERFADDPEVAGYDLMNEPNAFSDEQRGGAVGDVRAGARRDPCG